jgi:hypothetical protein
MPAVTRRERILKEAVAQAKVPERISNLEAESVSEADLAEDLKGQPRRSKRKRTEGGGADKKHVLPPLHAQAEGELLAESVFGQSVLHNLPAEDKGARISH